MNKTDNSKRVNLYSVAEGQLIRLEEVDDITFSSKMMGNGYAIRPTEGTITSPMDGEVTELFPTNHVVGFKSGNFQLLLHMGINTVKLNGKPFETDIYENQKVGPESVISEVDLEMLDQPGISNDMIVICVNGRKVVDEFVLYDLDEVSRGEEIGYVILK